MDITPVIGMLIVANALLSFMGFQDFSFTIKYMFNVHPIRQANEVYRLVSSGFLHVGWVHLAFNMYALYIFGIAIESAIGSLMTLVLYFASLVGGNLLALIIHRNHEDYTAVGASGAVSGIIFSYVLLSPDGMIGLIFIPIYIPAWIYALLFVLVSIYGIKSQSGNIGHEAHLGGALLGMLITLAMYPQILTNEPVLVISTLIPVALFLAVIIRRPELLGHGISWKQMFRITKDDAAHFVRSTTKKTNVKMFKKDADRPEAMELDALLDKINHEGYESLTPREKQMLDKISKRMNRDGEDNGSMPE